MPVPSNQDPAATGAVTDPAHLLPAHATEEPGSRKSGWRKWIILLVLLVIAAVIGWRIHANNAETKDAAAKAAAAANRPTPVQTVLVQQKTVPVFLSALGTVTAYNTVTLHSRVDGQLLSVNFVEGQAVKKGQLLLQIDPRPYQAALDQAIGTLAKDEANSKNAEAEAQRYTALYQAGVVSKESQQSQISTAGQAAGSIKADQAAIEAAKVNLGYTKIYSPIDGVVGLRQVDPGNIVHAADTTGLVVITQIHPMAIVFTLPEDQLPQVQQAMKGGSKLVVEAYDRSDSHKIASGTLLTIDNQIDTTTGTAKLKAVFDNLDNALFANQFVNVRLILRERPNALVIPTAAIQSGTQGDYVFVVNPGPTPANKMQNQPAAKMAKSGKGTSAAPAADTADAGKGKDGKPRQQFHADSVTIHVDLTIGTQTVVSDGELQPGQQVVVDGQEKLVDGGNVVPTPAKSNNIPATSGGVGAGANNSQPNAGGVPQTGAVPSAGQHAASKESGTGNAGNSSGGNR